MAVISQTEGAHKRWLCQWNKHWCRYFLVGGHEKAGETAAECMVREIEEELGLSAGVDYEPLSAATPLRCTDWSTSAWRMTDYSISIFDVKVNEAALSKVTKDAANRWVTADEIRSERCSDGKLISPTTCKVLGKLRAI
jgi:ADP-ribose pyrophosphatase YjhB (NUDIX family)